MKRVSDSYFGTFDFACADDMLRLEEFKAMVKNMNRMLREENVGKAFRVVLRGRKPANKIDGYSYDRCGNIVGGIANATRVDAYLYRKTNY